jgi:spermidine synthase
VSRLVFIIGILLLGTAGAVTLFTGSRRARFVAPPLVAVAIALWVWTAPGKSAAPGVGVVAVEQSRHGEIRVVDIADTRHMVIDGGTHTIVDRVTGESYFAYVNVLDLARGFFPQPGEMLLLGLGGGSVAKHYAAAGWKVDAVEIDPVVTKFAHSHFGLSTEAASVVEMDARQFLITYATSYDLIVMDAFGSSAIPFHLVTSEAFALIRSRLRPGGVLAMNTESVGWDDVLIRSLWATAKTQFAHVVALPIAEPPNQLGNVVILAGDRPLELPVEPPVPTDRFSPEYDRTHAWDNRFQPDRGGAPVLTDDLNPVDIWAERINLAARKQLREYFGERAEVW